MIVPKYGTTSDGSQAGPLSEATPCDNIRHMFGSVAAIVGETDLRALGPFPVPDAYLSDADIRSSLRLLKSGSDVVLEEVECWRGYARADFVCLAGERLSVIEIKSDQDSLRRFSEQVRVYSAIADQVTLVVGWSLAARALRAAPPWWQVVLAERQSGSSIRFVLLREGAANPESVAVGLLAMLPLERLRELAGACGLSPARRRREELRHLVATLISEDQVRGAISEWLTVLSAQRAGITA